MFTEKLFARLVLYSVVCQAFAYFTLYDFGYVWIDQVVNTDEVQSVRVDCVADLVLDPELLRGTEGKYLLLLYHSPIKLL